jgi:hypothetical protein
MLDSTWLSPEICAIECGVTFLGTGVVKNGREKTRKGVNRNIEELAKMLVCRCYMRGGQKEVGKSERNVIIHGRLR